MTLEDVKLMSVEERLELLELIRESFQKPVDEEERRKAVGELLEARHQAVLDGREVVHDWDDVEHLV